jgi:hypothetical protein
MSPVKTRIVNVVVFFAAALASACGPKAEPPEPAPAAQANGDVKPALPEDVKKGLAEVAAIPRSRPRIHRS